jgi:hypothetical protein
LHKYPRQHNYISYEYNFEFIYYDGFTAIANFDFAMKYNENYENLSITQSYFFFIQDVFRKNHYMRRIRTKIIKAIKEIENNNIIIKNGKYEGD